MKTSFISRGQQRSKKRLTNNERKADPLIYEKAAFEGSFDQANKHEIKSLLMAIRVSLRSSDIDQSLCSRF